jgi:competence protein ComEC
MEKPKLFETQKQFVLTLAVLLLLLLVRLGYAYQTYREFTSLPFFYTTAEVLTAYEKKKENSSYQVLKLKSREGHTFYTTTHRKEDLSHAHLRIELFPDKSISFWDYLGTCYIKSRIKKVYPQPRDLKTELMDTVSKQHRDPALQRFYNAIFFAAPLSKCDRETISRLGVSHLVALSGFHLGILWGLIYGVLLILYRPLQQRLFPYRYAMIDVGILSILFLGLYVWFVGMPPSLLRAYAMVIAGWVMLIMAVELVSFGFLTVVMAALPVLFPSLLVSLGFWFSVAGVFYIFLLLHYTKGWNKWVVMLAVIPLGIFVLMLPIVHIFFPVISVCQLLSPLLSLLFTPFYPISMLLHLIGQGDLMDGGLHYLLSLPCHTKEVLVPWWAGMGYLLLSVAAIEYRWVFILLLGVVTAFGVWLYI